MYHELVVLKIMWVQQQDPFDSVSGRLSWDMQSGVLGVGAVQYIILSKIMIKIVFTLARQLNSVVSGRWWQGYH